MQKKEFWHAVKRFVFNGNTLIFIIIALLFSSSAFLENETDETMTRYEAEIKKARHVLSELPDSGKKTITLDGNAPLSKNSQWLSTDEWQGFEGPEGLVAKFLYLRNLKERPVKIRGYTEYEVMCPDGKRKFLGVVIDTTATN